MGMLKIETSSHRLVDGVDRLVASAFQDSITINSVHEAARLAALYPESGFSTPAIAAMIVRRAAQKAGVGVLIGE
jgi:hypothetical protein